MKNLTVFKKRLLAFLSCLLVSSAAFAQTTQQGLQTNQIVKIPATMAQKANEGANKRILSYIALEQYLTEFFAQNKVEDQKKFQAWVKQISRKRFESLVPSWSVQIKTASEAEVNLVVSKIVLESDVEHSPFPGLLEQYFPQSSLSKNSSTTKLPLAAILFDESSQDAFVYPALEGESYSSKRFRVTPVSFKNEKSYSEQDINTLSISLPERLVRYTTTLKKHFPKQSFELDSRWAASAFKAVNIATIALEGSLSSFSNTTATPSVFRWPLPVATLNANLPNHPGAVFIFTVRSADKTGVIEKVDVLKFGDKQPSRTFWTRHLHDPLYKEQPTKIFERVYAFYQKSTSYKAPDLVQSAIKLIIDRRVSDKDVVALEAILKNFVKGSDLTLMPMEVTRDDYRYSSPVDPHQIDKIAAKINGELSHLYARVVPSADKNQLQVVPKSTPN